MLTPLSSLAVRKNNVTLWKALDLLAFGYTRNQLQASMLQSAYSGATGIWKSAFIALGRRTTPEIWRDSLANAALGGHLALYQIIEEEMLTKSHCRAEHLSLDRILSGAVESGNPEMLTYIMASRPKAIAHAKWEGLMHSALRSYSVYMMDTVYRLAPLHEREAFNWYSLIYTAVHTNNYNAVNWICSHLEFRVPIDWNVFAGHYTGGDNDIQQRLNDASDRTIRYNVVAKDAKVAEAYSRLAA